MPDDVGHSDDLAGLRPVRARIHQIGQLITTANEGDLRDRGVGQRETMRASRCLTCGAEPVDARACWAQREDLAIVWLYPIPSGPMPSPKLTIAPNAGHTNTLRPLPARCTGLVCAQHHSHRSWTPTPHENCRVTVSP